MFIYMLIYIRYICTYGCIWDAIYIHIAYDTIKLDELEILTSKSGFVKKKIVFVTKCREGKCFLKNETTRAVSVTITRKE